MADHVARGGGVFRWRGASKQRVLKRLRLAGFATRALRVADTLHPGSSSSVDRGSPTRLDDPAAARRRAYRLPCIATRPSKALGTGSGRLRRPRPTTVRVASSEARGFLGRSGPSDVTPPRRRTSRTRFAYAVPSGPTIEPVVRCGGRRRGGHDNLGEGDRLSVFLYLDT